MYSPGTHQLGFYHAFKVSYSKHGWLYCFCTVSWNSEKFIRPMWSALYVWAGVFASICWMSFMREPSSLRDCRTIGSDRLLCLLGLLKIPLGSRANVSKVLLQLSSSYRWRSCAASFNLFTSSEFCILLSSSLPLGAVIVFNFPHIKLVSAAILCIHLLNLIWSIQEYEAETQ